MCVINGPASVSRSTHVSPPPPLRSQVVRISDATCRGPGCREEDLAGPQREVGKTKRGLAGGITASPGQQPASDWAVLACGEGEGEPQL